MTIYIELQLISLICEWNKCSWSQTRSIYGFKCV